MLLYRPRKARGIVGCLLLDLPNEFRNETLQPPVLVSRRPSHAASRASTLKALQGKVGLLEFPY